MVLFNKCFIRQVSWEMCGDWFEIGHVGSPVAYIYTHHKQGQIFSNISKSILPILII